MLSANSSRPAAHRFAKRAAVTSLALAGLAFMLGGVAAHRAIAIAAGFFAKELCSGVFVSQRAAERVVAEDLRVYRPSILFNYIDWTVDTAARAVHARFLGLTQRVAQFAPGMGCSLHYARSGFSSGVATLDSGGRAQGAFASDSIDAGGALAEVVAAAFTEPDRTRPRRTRAVVVMHHGKIVAERYAEGVDAQTPLAGWSMAKSVVNALIGVLVHEGHLALDASLCALAPRLADVWPDAADPRRTITVAQALAMTTGLAFDERYSNPFGDVMPMLFLEPDAAAVAARKPLANPPGTTWAYASGTTNLLLRAILESLPESRRAGFATRVLFEPLGMASAVFESDATATPVGSSFLYASARDWARFGALFAADGVWNGRRILPPGWVAASRAAATGSGGRFGAHWWLREQEPTNVTLPEDAFFAAGHAGQRLTVVPSRGAVIVRLGLTLDAGAWDHPRFVAAVLAALPRN